MPKAQLYEMPTRQTNPFARWEPPKKKHFAIIFAERVKKAREQANLTQQEIADQLGMRQTGYAKYEARAGRSPTMMPHIYLERFCEITGAKISELLRDPR